MELRRANKDDCRDLYEWRNSPSARQNSLDQREIPYEDHVQWFEGSLNNKNRTIYIALEGNKKVGQIRFDLEEINLAKVSVTVKPEEQGKGYGPKIIEEGSNKYFSETGVSMIRAEIRQENVPSVKAFEKAGYKFFGESKGVLEYILKNG